MKGLFLIFLFAFNCVLGQQTLDTSNILPKKIISVDFLNIGSSFPIGSFSKRIKTGENSGFANVGIKLDAAFNYQIYKNLGVKSMLIFQNHQIDDYKYKKELYAENAANSYTLNTRGWTNISALFGAYAKFNVDENLSIQPKILLGFNYGISPIINLTVEDSSKTLVNIRQDKGNAFAFCYILGVDFNISLINNYHLLLGFDSFNSDLFFEDVKVKNITYNNNSEFKFKQPIQTLGFKIGIGKIIN